MMILTAAISGWEAELVLGFCNREGRTILATRKQRGPLAVQRSFYPEPMGLMPEACHTYLLHPPGGVVGGDMLQIKVAVDSGAHAVLTTPGATKFYRSVEKRALQEQCFSVEADGFLEWLPQENIFFPGAQAVLRSKIQLADCARYMGWEVHCLGRPANNERFARGDVRFYTVVYRGERPMLIESVKVGSDLDLRCGLRDFPVMGTLLATPATSLLLERVREAGAQDWQDADMVVGVTLLQDVLIVRTLGRETEKIMRFYRHLWGIIRPVLSGKSAVMPRIWAC